MKTAIVVFLCIFVSLGFLQAEHQFLEVITLKDGSVIKGLILEFTPDRLVIIATRPEVTHALELTEVESIEKSCDPKDMVEIEYIDVLYLRDGVIFPGTIVERIPGRLLTLELKNGSMVSLDENEVWKMVRRRILAGEVPLEDRERLDTTRLELQIELVGRQLQQEPGAAAQEDLEQEIARLKEQLPAKRELDQQEIEELKTIHAALKQQTDHLAELAAQRTGGQESATPPGAAETANIEAVRSDLQILAGSPNWTRESNREYMEELVSKLPFEQREDLYEEHKKGNPKKMMYINALSLVGAGNWIHRDYRGALVQSGLLLGGLILFASGFEVVPKPERTYGIGISLTPFGHVGIGSAAASYVFSLVQPFLFVRRYNQELATSLGLEEQGDH